MAFHLVFPPPCRKVYYFYTVQCCRCTWAEWLRWQGIFYSFVRMQNVFWMLPNENFRFVLNTGFWQFLVVAVREEARIIVHCLFLIIRFRTNKIRNAVDLIRIAWSIHAFIKKLSLRAFYHKKYCFHLEHEMSLKVAYDSVDICCKTESLFGYENPILQVCISKITIFS